MPPEFDSCEWQFPLKRCKYACFRFFRLIFIVALIGGDSK